MATIGELLLRVFVEVGSQDEASKVAVRIANLVGGFSSITHRTIEKYWKIPEYYELFFRLKPFEDGTSAYEKGLKILGDGWISVNSTESVWTPDEGGRFGIDDVRWASFELVAR